MALTTLFPAARVGLEGKHVRTVVNISSRNLMVFSCYHDAKTGVFKSDADKKLVYFFANHVSPSYSMGDVRMVHLFEVVLCSANIDGIITRYASLRTLQSS